MNKSKNTQKTKVGNRKAGSRSNAKVQNQQQREKSSPQRNGNMQRSVAAAYATGNSGKAPKLSYQKGSVRVQHRELVTNVSGLNDNGAFSVASSVALNPGLSQSFPWLSNLAQNYESYRFHKLRFCYYTRTGSNTPGSVILAPDYDASDPSPGSEQTVSTYEDVQEDAPWKDICCTLRPAAMFSAGPHKFVRQNALAANQDIKLYDCGNFFICRVDSSAAASWGKVWVEYDVELFTPQLPSLEANIPAGKYTGSTGLTGAKPFGSAVTTVENTSPLLTYTNAGALWTFQQPYQGLLSVAYVGTVISASGQFTNTSCTSLTNVTAANMFDAGGLNATATCFVNALAGQQFVAPVTTATTITSSILRVGVYPTVLA